MSARLLILFQIFVGDFLRRLERHPTVAPNMKTERADSTQHRHDRPEEKPDRDRHVLGAFAILGAVTERTRHRLPERRKNGREQDRENFRFHVMMRSRFIFW